MKRSGTADLPLHYGHIPKWLSLRMSRLGLAITEAIITEYGTAEVLRRLSDPFWFQSLGAVMGMDWHSSGITTSVMGALKSAINPLSKELGIYICGGKGKSSRQTPQELLHYSERNGLNGTDLVRCSKLSAKVDNTAIQDGFQLYMHSFIVNTDGLWTVVQQGMQDGSSTARRYHWHSAEMKSFVDDPHTAICGVNQGTIMNMVTQAAQPARLSMLSMTTEHPSRMIAEIQQLVLPNHHEVKAKDVDLKRLGAMLWLTHERQPADFEELLLLEGMGPRTLQSMALVSEVIYGTPSRFKDPARFSFAHGGKDGHPFPVPLKVYDETISILTKAVNKAKIGESDKLQAIQKLGELSRQAEKDFIPNDNFEELLERERNNSWKYGGKTIFGDAKPPEGGQLDLF
ncbi:hypothetical protein HDE69_002486 [Pedobacter cryoconitis]|uniref:DUF763 domain-containing protein n=1 Tax=Pedobacter cryoconitis TaxID=188932 RepID=A0A7W8YTC1_9SPHI|nr:DUF763 domain-containing protein [Pedobacter cryoconitis]MBB5621425.1 hypothetical protein [Pedobacter cryoconitis]MBB5643759.1 hypothetical protein [Pedobacter cryoconitis]